MNEDKILPKGWVYTNLGEVCKLKNGYAFKSSDYLKESGIPIIRISDIGDGKVDLTSCVRIKEDAEYDNYIVHRNEILVAMSGATTGKFGIYKGDEKVYQNQRVGKFEVLYKEALSNSYLLYLLYSLKHIILKDAYGGAQPNISSGKIEELPFPLPPLPEQHRIVAKIEELFSSLDKGIESLKTAQQQLKVYRQAVLKWAFEGRLTNSNTNKWNFETFKECLKFSQGFQVDVELQSEIKKSGQIRFLRIIDFTQGNEPERYIDHPGEKYFVAKDDISIVRYGASTGFVCSGKEGIIANNLFKIEPNQKINKRFLFYFLKSSFFQQFIAKNVKGAAMPAISFGLINDIVLPIPPTLEEQHRIVSEIEKRLSVADKLEESIATALQQAEALRQSILKKAFEGKLLSEAELEECRNDPNWEPASVLLERIASAKLSTRRAERHNKTSQDKNKPAKNRVKS